MLFKSKREIFFRCELSNVRGMTQMRMIDLIVKKKRGEELSSDEINFIVQGFLNDEIPKEQMSAFLMAVCFQSMTERETIFLTNAMQQGSEHLDLSKICPGKIKVDKHSTGGVGDKTTLIILPIVAACGGVIAKMSGRGLGHTGGTIDKLESIRGFQTQLTQEKFKELVEKNHCALMSQSNEIAPADKKIYALRDVTGTVDSMPLIASSVMSKKLTSGADAILLDVTVGHGAFMKDLESAIELARLMCLIGEQANKKMMAIVSDMDAPLGNSVGNALEVEEAMQILKGEEKETSQDLKTVAIKLAGAMLFLSNVAKTIEDGEMLAKKSLDDGSAYKKFCEFIHAQGGDEKNLPKAIYNMRVLAPKRGRVSQIDAEKIGVASMILGAGREKLEDKLDMTAGVTLVKKVGDFVKKGDTIAIVHTSLHDEEKIKSAMKMISQAYGVTENEIQTRPIILARVYQNKIERFV